MDKDKKEPKKQEEAKPFSEEPIVAIELTNSVAGLYKDVPYSFGAGDQVDTFKGLAEDLVNAGHAVLKDKK